MLAPSHHKVLQNLKTGSVTFHFKDKTTIESRLRRTTVGHPINHIAHHGHVGLNLTLYDTKRA